VCFAPDIRSCCSCLRRAMACRHLHGGRSFVWCLAAAAAGRAEANCCGFQLAGVRPQPCTAFAVDQNRLIVMLVVPLCCSTLCQQATMHACSHHICSCLAAFIPHLCWLHHVMSLQAGMCCLFCCSYCFVNRFFWPYTALCPGSALTGHHVVLMMSARDWSIRVPLLLLPFCSLLVSDPSP
jgi:hypothetical protein